MIQIHEILKSTGDTYFLVSPNERLRCCQFDLQYEANRALNKVVIDPTTELLANGYAIILVSRYGSFMINHFAPLYSYSIQVNQQSLHDVEWSEFIVALIRYLDTKLHVICRWQVTGYTIFEGKAKVCFTHNSRGATFLRLLLRARRQIPLQGNP